MFRGEIHISTEAFFLVENIKDDDFFLGQCVNVIPKKREENESENKIEVNQTVYILLIELNFSIFSSLSLARFQLHLIHL